MTHEYKSALATVCSSCFGDLVASEWQSLVPLINEEVLQDAHKAGTAYSELFGGLLHIQRPKKTMARVQVKARTQRPDVPFKVNSDLCGFKFEVDNVKMIKHVMDFVQMGVTNAGGMFFIRNSIETDGKLTDIVMYAFAYVPSISYIAEIQVGHPFALYTFTRDSLLRDKRFNNEPTDGLVDLWDNDLYGHVKAKILDPTQDVDMLALWPNKDVSIDEELQSILSNIGVKTV